MVSPRKMNGEASGVARTGLFFSSAAALTTDHSHSKQTKQLKRHHQGLLVWWFSWVFKGGTVFWSEFVKYIWILNIWIFWILYLGAKNNYRLLDFVNSSKNSRNKGTMPKISKHIKFLSKYPPKVKIQTHIPTNGWLTWFIGRPRIFWGANIYIQSFRANMHSLY